MHSTNLLLLIYSILTILLLYGRKGEKVLIRGNSVNRGFLGIRVQRYSDY